jgi:L-alanine-DL-glutamate epimerase-like enolase superfamily enzyme
VATAEASASCPSAITGIEAIPVRLPLRRHWHWRGMTGELGHWLVVRVRTAAGQVGYGEATPLPDWGGDHQRYAGETQQTVTHVVRDLFAPLLAGLDAFELQTAQSRMDASLRGHPYAKAAVEMALLDVQGKLSGQPLYRLLGGACRDSVPLAHMIGLMPVPDAVAEAEAVVAEGTRALQVKGTGEFGRDQAVLAAVRRAVGDAIILRFDANQGYRNRPVKQAIRELRALADIGADLIEQPGEGLRQMAEMRAGLDIPVIADESAWQPLDVLAVARAGAADAISVYIAKAGGVRRAQLAAAFARELGLVCDVNGSLESGIGSAANLHLALSSPAVTLPCVIPASAPAGTTTRLTGRYFADDLIAEPMGLRDGALQPLTGPGLGVTVDDEKLTAYRVDR